MRNNIEYILYSRHPRWLKISAIVEEGIDGKCYGFGVRGYVVIIKKLKNDMGEGAITFVVWLSLHYAKD